MKQTSKAKRKMHIKDIAENQTSSINLKKKNEVGGTKYLAV
jgi:hypothetical protein